MILTKQLIQIHIAGHNIDTTKPFHLDFSFPESFITSASLFTSIEADAFDGLHNLEWLNLSGNQMSLIENKLYGSREEILKLIEKLKSLEVMENNGSISDLKNNNLSQIGGQDCGTITINHSIPLEKSSKIFEEIAKIRQNRPALHGSAYDNFKKIAALWSAYLDTKVTIQDVGFMMAMLKAVRHKNGDKDNIDNFVDGANYIALAGEMLDSYPPHSNN